MEIPNNDPKYKEPTLLNAVSIISKDEDDISKFYIDEYLPYDAKAVTNEELKDKITYSVIKESLDLQQKQKQIQDYNNKIFAFYGMVLFNVHYVMRKQYLNVGI